MPRVPIGRLVLATFVFIAGWLFLRSVVLSSSSQVGLASAPHWLLEVLAAGLSGVLLASLWLFSMIRDSLAAIRDPETTVVRDLLFEQMAATALLALSFVLIGFCAWQGAV